MGVVYEALDPKLERHVAIKMILGATPGLLARFDREARSTGSLQHQNIVTIYEFGDQEGSPYLVMEYLEGSEPGLRFVFRTEAEASPPGSAFAWMCARAELRRTTDGGYHPSRHQAGEHHVAGRWQCEDRGFPALRALATLVPATQR